MLAHGFVDDFKNIESAEWAGMYLSNLSLPGDWSAWLASYSKVFAWMTDADGCFSRQVRNACHGEFHLIHPIVDPAGLHAVEQLAGKLTQDSAFAFHHHHPSPTPSLALHFGSGSKSKNWPIEHWKSFLEILASNHSKLPLFIISGEADASERQALQPTIESIPNPIVVAENWPLTRLAKHLSECAAYVGHDTGVSHLAALCGLPSLWLFGPTNPSVWAPRRSNVHCLRADLKTLGPSVVWDRLQLLLTIPTSKPSGP